MARTVVLSLGSNLGERFGNLRRAVNLLSKRLRLVRISRVFETAAVDSGPGAPAFLNLAIVALWEGTPAALLLVTQGVERQLGRKRSRRNAPRPIDIDVILFSGESLRTSDLTLPHPRFRARSFVLDPLREIAPAWIIEGERLERMHGSGATAVVGELYR